MSSGARTCYIKKVLKAFLFVKNLCWQKKIIFMWSLVDESDFDATISESNIMCLR